MRPRSVWTNRPSDGLVEIDVPAGYTTTLPVPTLVIRTDNQDSYQGPVSGLPNG